MSIFCPKCGKRTYDEYTCDYCQHKIKKIDYKKEGTNKNFKFKNNLIIIIPMIIIAIGISYIAYTKYQERRMIEKVTKEIYGTKNIESFINMSDKERKKTFNNSKNTKRIKKELNKIVKSYKLIDLPITINKRNNIKINSNEKNEKRKRNERTKAKEDLKKQMSF